MWRMRLTGKPPLIVIAGPTAVGKTGLAVEIAQATRGEVIGADSRQIYRYMDIGTAKPTPDQRRQAPHHLLDVVDPDDNLSLAQYQALAYAAINAVHQRGCVPLLVGGTGQYLTAVIEGWSIPQVPPDPALRAELEAYAAEHGPQALHTRLRQHDPAAAQAIHQQNVRRVIRALEVFIQTGQPISQLQQKKPPAYRILQYGLTLDRDQLYKRADQRLDEMIRQGFIDEVRDLLDMGYDRHLPSMSGLGYAQLAAYVLGEVSYDEAITSTRRATRDFIRRQYTWFRGHDSGLIWHDMAQPDTAAIIATVTGWLEETA
jgi:tRNA dimethylallyltransferase